MFKAGSRHGEMQGFPVISGPGEKTINKPSHKGIAATHAVNDMGDLVNGGFIAFSPSEYAGPAVVVGIHRSAKCGNHLFAAGKRFMICRDTDS